MLDLCQWQRHLRKPRHTRNAHEAERWAREVRQVRFNAKARRNVSRCRNADRAVFANPLSD